MRKKNHTRTPNHDEMNTFLGKLPQKKAFRAHDHRAIMIFRATFFILFWANQLKSKRSKYKTKNPTRTLNRHRGVMIWPKSPRKKVLRTHSRRALMILRGFFIFDYEQIALYMRSKNKQKNCAHTPNHNAVVIYRASFFHLALSKSPSKYKL